MTNRSRSNRPPRGARVKLAKWGNSLALRVPQAAARELGVADGSQVTVSAVNGELVATPVEHRPDLDELVKQITTENLHRPTDWGGPVGREAW